MTSQFLKNSNMTLSRYTRAAALAGGALTLLVPVVAIAQGSSVDAALNGSATVQTQGASVRAGVQASTTLSAAVMTRAKAKADSEIDRRIKALTELNTRVQAMTKITVEFKQNLSTNIQAQISGLAQLKAKIDADTDGATLRTDIQTIGQAYRIFMLIMPQARIAAAADREATIINQLAGIGTKLQARIEAAGTAGADVTAMASALADMGTKLASAQAHAQAAIAGSATLNPDQGDAAKMKANTDALQAARKEIEAAHQDLIAARKDVDVILKGLRTASAGAAASSTIKTQ